MCSAMQTTYYWPALDPTVIGLQRLINCANSYIMSHGLRFNLSKTHCASFGKITGAEWYLGGDRLLQEDRIQYLGAVLSESPHHHVDSRIAACRCAFYAMQGAGLCKQGLNPDGVRYLWHAAVRPVLLYHSAVADKSRFLRVWWQTRVESDDIRIRPGKGSIWPMRITFLLYNVIYWPSLLICANDNVYYNSHSLILCHITICMEISYEYNWFYGHFGRK